MENSFEHAFFPLTTIASGMGIEVLPDVFCLPIQIANVCFVGDPDAKDSWVLIDAGMPRSADHIIVESVKRFGGRAPRGIVLTHGHFDHVGAIVDLIEHWGVPVYAHELELPYLTGKADYPKGDPTVDGGLVSELSPFFPNQGIDLGNHVQALPHTGVIPILDGWRWVHTPGHTPGHISLFRQTDRCLISGDAVVTVRQESLLKVILQEPELHGPPKYYTTDWLAAWESVKRLAALRPSVLVAGHGLPMQGDHLPQALDAFARDFNRTEVPEHGRFLH